MGQEVSEVEERVKVRGMELQQLVIMEFIDPEGRAWMAGATITRLRPRDTSVGDNDRRQIVEGDGLKLTGIRVVTDR